MEVLRRELSSEVSFHDLHCVLDTWLRHECSHPSKALFAKNPDSYEDLVKAARKMAIRLSSKRERLLDLTLPIVSYFNGSRFNNGIKDCIGATTKINELILNFFCVSTDLCRSAQVIHTKGLCWKYLRASMSLHGYLVSNK